jgi:hypothetical protein
MAPTLSMTTSLGWERRVVVSSAHYESEKTVMVVRRCGAHEPELSYMMPKDRVSLRQRRKRLGSFNWIWRGAL